MFEALNTFVVLNSEALESPMIRGRQLWVHHPIMLVLSDSGRFTQFDSFCELEITDKNRKLDLVIYNLLDLLVVYLVGYSIAGGYFALCNSSQDFLLLSTFCSPGT